MVNAEAEARANADTNLKSQVDKVNIDLNTEVSKREAGDTVLQQNIDKEISDRTSADTLLDNKFTGLINTESTARANEDEKINARIDQEIKDRKAGDDALSTRIDSLNSGVTGSLDELREKVTNNTTAIQTEVERAKAAEQALKDSLTTAMENHKDDLVAISKDINDEAQSRLQEDTKLQNNIDTETLNRTQADTLLENKITQEVSDRVQAVENLNDRKVDKVDGKELSSNDFTDLLKAKLDNIQEFANYITKVSQLENDSNYQNAEQVEAAIQKVIGSAPGVLDTLEEIAKALGDDPNFATTITNKLTELKGIIDKEISDRTAADEQVTQKFTELSTTLNATVSELRTFVTETRSELLTKAQAQDELIAKNTANIQRNLELIQGLQSNQNTGYLEIKELLNTEIEARKAEDIRIEAKVDKNTQDLTTERNERIAADKVLQDNIDAEEAARIAEDKKINARIDKEIQDRTDADTALDNKFTAITNDHEERLVAEEGTSDALPGTMVTDVSAVTRNATQLTFKVKTSTKDQENNQYGDEVEATKNLLPVTQTLAGVMSAADKVKLDGLDPNAITEISAASDADKVTVTVTKDNGLNDDTTDTFDLPVVSADKAGTMTAKDKVELDRINTANFALGAVTPNETTVGIAATKTNVEDGTTVQNPITLPSSTPEKAGVQSAADKKLFDSIPDKVIILSGDKPVEVVQQSSHVTLTHKFSSKKKSGIYTSEAGDFKTTYIPAATETLAGVMTAADKVNLDETLPDAIAQEVQDRKDAIEALTNSSTAALNKEIQDRKDADTALDTKFTKAVADEAKARTDADTALGARIDKEISDRTAADTALDNKLQANIDALEAKHDAFVATKGKANGFASLDANGTVPANQLPSYVDDIIDVYATYDKSATGELTNIKLYSDAAHQNAITGEAGKIYINITNGEPPYQFRWTGTIFARADAQVLILGQITGTAFDGGRGKELEDQVASLKANGASHFDNNTYQASTVRLNFKCWFGNGNIQDHYSQITAATASRAGVMTAADKVKLDTTLPNQIATETTNRTNADNAITAKINSFPDHILGRDLKNSGNLINLITSATKLTIGYWWTKRKEDGSFQVNETQHTFDIPAATQTVAGVMTAADKKNLDNTVTGLANEITNRTNAINSLRTELKTYIDDEVGNTDTDLTALETKVNQHIANKSNPHGVTKAQVGLGNVQNLAPADMPVSTAQAAAIADAKAAGTKAQTDLSTHANRKDNPHNVTRAQLGLATTDQVVFAKTTAASGFWKESDGRLKSQVENLNHTLDQICNIPTVHFKMNGKYQVGTIAQSLEEIEPLLVSENTIPASQVPNQSRFETFVGEDGQEYVKVKVVEYEMLSVMALEGVKLLRKEFEDFKKQLNNK